MPTTERNESSIALVELRETLKLSQQNFSTALGVTISTIARWETSDPPKGYSLIRLALLAGDRMLPEIRDRFIALYVRELPEIIRCPKCGSSLSGTEPQIVEESLP